MGDWIYLDFDIISPVALNFESIVQFYECQTLVVACQDVCDRLFLADFS